jgi:hypothetical protein
MMILRGWMVMLLGFFLGAIAAYIAMAFVHWDLSFFVPEKAGPVVRVGLLFVMVLGGLGGSFPLIGWAVDLDIQNRKR